MIADESPLKVLQLVLSLDVGGLEQLLFGFTSRSDPRRLRHVVVCLEGPGTLAPRFEAAGVPVRALGTSGRLRAALRLGRMVRRERPHVLHTHNLPAHLVGALVRLTCGLRLLVHTRHSPSRLEPRRLLWAVRAASWLSDAVVPVSEHAAVQVRRLERTPQGRVVVIPNGIELPSPPKRGTRPVRYGISVARLDPIKDQASLLRAVRRIVDKVPDFKLELVGEGAERPRLERLRDELGLRAHVLLSGHCDDVALRLARADVFFLTSLSEGLPLSLLEAMASALPVIATDVGGNREVVVQGETGLLVPAGSAEEVAEAALSLVREPHRAGALGLAGRARVESLFSLEGMIARYERLYRSRLAPRHRRWVPAAREV